MNELFVEAYGERLAFAIAREELPFDSRFVASGLGIEHEELLLAILEHKDDLEDYGNVEVFNGGVMLNPAQVVGVSLFNADTRAPEAREFLTYIVYRALLSRALEIGRGLVFDRHEDIGVYWGRAITALALLSETHATIDSSHREDPQPYAESMVDEVLATSIEQARSLRAIRRAIEAASEADSDIEAIVNAHPGAFESIR
jgi:hypothetical protein